MIHSDKENLINMKEENVMSVCDGESKPCESCPERFYSVDSLYRHFVEIHEKVSCPFCSKVYSGIKDTRRHVHQAHNVHRQPDHRASPDCKCRKCGMVLKNSRGREQHERFELCSKQCSKCFKVFRTERDVKVHLTEGPPCVPRGKANWYQCPSTFVPEPEASSDENEQTLKLPFECDECGKGFRKASYLKEHTEAVHLKIRYECPQCDMTGQQRRRVISHMRKVHNVSTEESNTLTIRKTFSGTELDNQKSNSTYQVRDQKYLIRSWIFVLEM